MRNLRKIGMLYFLCLCGMVFSNNSKTNFILIMTDDQGWASMTPRHSIQKTPGLDTLIANGIHFSRFYSASAVCSPTRGSFVTGRNPFRLGIPTANKGHIDTGENTIGELARSAGYTTGHFGKWHLGTLTKLKSDGNRGKKNPEDYAPPWDHGFDRTFATEAKVPTWHPMESIDNIPHLSNTGNFFGTYFWQGYEDTVAFDQLRGDAARLITDHALNFVDSAMSEDTPFLMNIWFHTPHYPVIVDQDTANAYYPSVSDNKNQAYYTSIDLMSRQVLRIYKHLEEKGILENTFILFTSDNGGAHTQNKAPQNAVGPLKGGKTNFYEGGIRVPGIISWPARVPQAIETDFPVVTSDIYPTVKAIMEQEVPNQKPIDGINLLPVIDALVAGQSDLKRNKPIGFLIGSSVTSPSKRAWIDGDYKIVKDGNGSWELYNVGTDTAESLNLSSQMSGKLNDMSSAFHQWNSLVNSDSPFHFEEETNAKLVPNNTSALLHSSVSRESFQQVKLYHLNGSYIGTWSLLEWKKHPYKNLNLTAGVYVLTFTKGAYSIKETFFIH